VREGARAASSTLVVHARSDRDGPSRAGVIVGRSVGGSVVRHRVARRLRAALVDQLDVVAPGTLIVARALPPSATATWDTLTRDLSSALRRALSRVGQQPGTPPVVSR